MNTRRLAIKSQSFLVFILTAYAVVLEPFVDADSRNYLVLLAALIGGLLFFLLGLGLQRQGIQALLLFVVMIIQAINIGGFVEIGSVALTFVYAIGYLAIAGLMHRVNDKHDFVLNMMRRIVYAFAVVSVLQMATSLAGVPVPNVIATKGLWSYNSLAFEPSQLGRVVGASMLCYLLMVRLKEKTLSPKARRDLINVSIAFLTTMLLSGSALAAVAILFVYGLSRSTTWLVFLAIGGILLWPIAYMIEFEPLRRAIVLANNLGSLDVDQVLYAEHSGGLRFAPLLVYLRDASVVESGFWLGYGSEGMTRFFLYQIIGLGDGTAAGFLPGFAVVYGFLGFLLFIWVFVLQLANRVTFPLIVFWAIFMTSSAWNTQVFWYGMIVIHIAWAATRGNSRRFKAK